MKTFSGKFDLGNGCRVAHAVVCLSFMKGCRGLIELSNMIFEIKSDLWLNVVTGFRMSGMLMDGSNSTLESMERRIPNTYWFDLFCLRTMDEPLTIPSFREKNGRKGSPLLWFFPHPRSVIRVAVFIHIGRSGWTFFRSQRNLLDQKGESRDYGEVVPYTSDILIRAVHARGHNEICLRRR